MLLVINRNNHGPSPTHGAVSVHGYQFVYYKSFILISDRATGTRSLILTDSRIDFIKLLNMITPRATAVHKRNLYKELSTYLQNASDVC